MSTIRYFDVPHVFRFGQRDDQTDHTWMRFYRAATCFEVTIDGPNIAGTPFEQEWARRAFAPTSHTNFVQNWNDFCDCILTQILPTLQELAAAGLRSWTTLEDYIKTTTYKLSLHKATTKTGNDDIQVKIDEGPTARPAFELHPELLSSLNFPLPNDLPHIPASVLKVLSQDKDLRQRPYKVQLPDFSLAYLIPTQGKIKSMPSGTIGNPSLSTIATHLNLHNLFTDPTTPHSHPRHIPRPLAIVTTPSAPPNPKSPDKPLSASEDAPNAPNQSTLTIPAPRFAGLLLTYLHHARPLSDTALITDITSFDDPTSTRQSLHKSLLQTIRVLHAKDPPIIHGNINPHTVMISVRLCPYLVGFSQDVANGLYIDHCRAGTKGADQEGLESTFGEDGWLAHKINQATGKVPTDQHWTKRAEVQATRRTECTGQLCVEEILDHNMLNLEVTEVTESR